jgi:hypothetical protein
MDQGKKKQYINLTELKRQKLKKAINNKKIFRKRLHETRGPRI